MNIQHVVIFISSTGVVPRLRIFFTIRYIQLHLNMILKFTTTLLGKLMHWVKCIWSLGNMVHQPLLSEQIDIRHRTTAAANSGKKANSQIGQRHFERLKNQIILV